MSSPASRHFRRGRPATSPGASAIRRVDFSMLNAAFYVQDDFRVRRNLTISPGLRYERQAHLNDWADLGPRVGVTWAPAKSGRTSLRASAGIFYDWLNQTTLEQVERVDGLHQQELNISNPPFPNAQTAGALPPANRYFLDPDLRTPRSTRFSGGIDQTFYSSPAWNVRANALYAYTRTDHAWRGRNENPLVAGLRADPRFANVVDVVSDADARQQQVTLGWNIGAAAAGAGQRAAAVVRVEAVRAVRQLRDDVGTQQHGRRFPAASRRHTRQPVGAIDPRHPVPAEHSTSSRCRSGARRSPAPSRRSAARRSRRQPGLMRTATACSTIGRRDWDETRSAVPISGCCRCMRLHDSVPPPGGPGHRHSRHRVHRQRGLERRGVLRQCPLSHDVVRAGAESHQPGQLRRLQRRADVTVLQPADDRSQSEADRVQCQLHVLGTSYLAGRCHHR